eukprot:CAMPEP_0203781462 /NCGR_PEP_ID=MMETSP0099_2-20121227/10257_1 /ASSEMBLY_ACC=CAM_ASM_000209 /TAXON_ID=96639 /ORGANISM=" , Strain NY0313808BC1" /LENGTH=89 /DNA_ID=CAMNT_0050682467 /DNA_START=280 /DNA_END=546 /DNA_ORIENTATION=+
MSSRDYSDDLLVAKRYFYAGFCFLPLLWILNVCNFWGMSRNAGAPPELGTCKYHFDQDRRNAGAPPELGTYVWGSLIGASIMVAIIAVW